MLVVGQVLRKSNTWTLRTLKDHWECGKPKSKVETKHRRLEFIVGYTSISDGYNDPKRLLNGMVEYWVYHRIGCPFSNSLAMSNVDWFGPSAAVWLHVLKPGLLHDRIQPHKLSKPNQKQIKLDLDPFLD